MKKFHTIKDKRIEAKKAIPKVEMDARKRGDPRAAMAGAMMALSGPPIDGPNGRSRASRSGACLWESNPYNAGSYAAGYSSQANCKCVNFIFISICPFSCESCRLILHFLVSQWMDIRLITTHHQHTMVQAPG